MLAASRLTAPTRAPRWHGSIPIKRMLGSIYDKIGILISVTSNCVDANLSENACVKTTVNIPDKVLRDAMRHTKAKTKREAIVKALEEMNRRYSQAELVKYFGKFESLMTNEEIETMEQDA
jgi:hypothetical protein